MGQPVVRWQIVTATPDRAADFYTQLFGWEINVDNALNYRMVDTGSERGIDGGIWPAPPGVTGFVQLFVEVDDVAACIERATARGAKVLIPPQKLPDGDELAILHDPSGIPFGVTRPAAV
jgi:predicted enzyme related to lactoylglutathione lyase